MNASKTLVTLIVAVCLIAPLAWADWIPSDGHKMHYPQLPDPSGWDVNAMVDQVFARKLADDWRCSESGPVKDIHFWGSYARSYRHEVCLPVIREQLQKAGVRLAAMLNWVLTEDEVSGCSCGSGG